jgi:small-conductance mechanosensitive channel
MHLKPGNPALNKLISTPLLIFFVIGFLSAGKTSAAVTDNPDSILSKASVVIDGYTLFSVRGITSFPASKRVRLIEDRIENIAKNELITPDSIKIIKGEICDTILVNHNVLLNVFDLDAEMEGVNRTLFSEIIKGKIISAVHNYRNERKSEALLSKTFYAIGATVIVILLVVILTWILKKVSLIIEKKLKTRFEHLETRSFQLIKSGQVWITVMGLVRAIKLIVFLVIFFVYIQYVLGLYPWTRSVSISLLNFFLTPLSTIGTAFLNFIPNLAFLVIIFLITRYILKLIKLFFVGIGNGAITFSGFEREWAQPSFKIVRILIIVFAIIVSYPYIPGSESDAFKGVSLFIGLLFSLGSSSIIGNLIAGYSMIYRRTFKPGDIVKIEDYLGQVIEVKIFVTRIRTLKNEEVIVPNSLILSNNIVNYSSILVSTKGIILHTTVGIGYETPWRQVEGMLKLAAERTEGILMDPPPYVLQKGLGDFAVNYELNVFCNDPINMLKHYTALHRNILDVFNENQVQIMTPAYKGDPDQPKIVPKEQWFTPVSGAGEKDKNAN